MSGYFIPGLAAIGALWLALLSIVYASWRNGISPMPSSAPLRRAVAAEVNRLPGYGTIVEAGSGWGGLALHLVRRCPGKRVIGVENSPVPLGFSRTAAWLWRLAEGDWGRERGRGAVAGSARRVHFVRGDLYAYPFGEVDIVVCYLFPGAMTRLGGLLAKRLTPGAYVISVCFALPGWEPERVVTCRDWYRTKVYVYRFAGETGEG